MSKDWKDKLSEKFNVPQNNPKGGNPVNPKQKNTSDYEKINFYTDIDKKIIDESLLTTKAQKWAKSFLNPQRESTNEKVKPLTSAQLRRFYHDAKKLEEQIKEKGFELFKPHIKLIDSKVAYAYRGGGKEQKVPKEFRNFMHDMIYSIEDQKDFEAFMLCFEAVVGYFYGDQKS